MRHKLFFTNILWPSNVDTQLFIIITFAQTYLQLPLQQWGADNFYLLVLSSWMVNIAENPIVVMGL